MMVMRAKLKCTTVLVTEHGEQLTCVAVAKSGYPADGSDEDNTYAKFSPSAKFEITVANPALFGRIRPGDKFYVDFSRAE